MQISTTLNTEEFSVRVVELPSSGERMSSLRGPIGRITINDFSETFLMDVSYWSVEQYLQNWHSALKELERSGGSTSCIVSSITDPKNSNFIVCWPMYRDGSDVYVQNHMVFLEEVEGEFDEERPWRHVRPRSVVDEDGVRISEWSTDIFQVINFRKFAWGD